MSVKLNLIAAACENMGIGKNNDLPWRLKKEMNYFTKMTSNTKNASKQNVVIMGRKTWDSVPEKFKPFSNRINFILTRSNLDLSKYDNVYAFNSWHSALEKLKDPSFNQGVENVWVIGGSQIYKESMESKYFYRLYLTKVLKTFDCDTYFPKLNSNLKEITDPNVPEELQREGDIEYIFKVYENPDFEN